MKILVLLVSFVILATSRATVTSSVELNEVSFDKIIRKFQASIVKFDVAFPYGEKHDSFVALAKDAQDVDELLVAEVGVKDYGEKDNEELAKKYGATKENFPQVKLFIQGKSEPIPFDDSNGFTTDALRKFVRENTGLYLSLPGCLRELDVLSIKFMQTKGDSRREVSNEVEKVIDNLNPKNLASGKIYAIIMSKIYQKGEEFVKAEYERVKKILSSKVSTEKKKELEIRINILQTFLLHDKQSLKEEL